MAAAEAATMFGVAVVVNVAAAAGGAVGSGAAELVDSADVDAVEFAVCDAAAAAFAVAVGSAAAAAAVVAGVLFLLLVLLLLLLLL